MVQKHLLAAERSVKIPMSGEKACDSFDDQSGHREPRLVIFPCCVPFRSAGLGLGKDLEYIENYLGKLIDAKGVRGRYVRLYSRGNTSNDLNHYIEVEVYGKPAAAPEKEKREPVAIELPRPIFP
jgi:hypothetical protein